MRIRLSLLMALLTVTTSALAAGAPAAAAAGQRIDLKVLLLGATGSEPSFGAWQAQLRREGVPFDQLVAAPGHAPITAATLSRTLADGTREGKYQAVILATGGLLDCSSNPCVSRLSNAEWTALQTYEQAFHVRQLTAYAFPGADFGLNPPTASGALDGQTATLTADGLKAFPYLNGPVAIDAGTFGYQATPADPARFTTLLTGPGGSSLVGVFAHPDGREELVQTFDGNQFQHHTELLRHGELSWVTRGVYLGDQRNYFEAQVDDVFLGDDGWDPATHSTSFDPARAIRMDAADAAKAVAWSRANGIRLDLAYNGAGSDAFAAANGGADPLLTALQASKASFGWINHTWDHSNLDCSTQAFISGQITQNVAWAQGKGLAVDAAELVTGEHSGLANLVPGNPGTIDPPGIDDATPSAGGGTLAAGTYDYAVTATSANGETIGSTTTQTTSGATGSVQLGWDAICQATSYKVYRRVSPAGAWALVGTVAQPGGAFTDAGPVELSFTDSGGAGSAAAPPASNTAALNPYGQNPAFTAALAQAGVRDVAGDASKPYPQAPTGIAGPQWPAGASFVDGPARVIPRYPTNVYYNAATQAQLLDEYNWLYLPPALGGSCVGSAVTTCRSAPATWAELVAAESQRILSHAMGNDPRPHYFHQSNIAQSGAAGGAVLYPVLDALLADYRREFATSAPLVQPTPSQIAALLARQDGWAAAGTGTVSGWIEGDRVTISNGGGAAVDVPLTGTEVGDPYGGTRSGWVSAPPGTSLHTASIAWPGTVTPPPVVTPPVTGPPVTQPVQHLPGAPGATQPPAAPGAQSGAVTPAKPKAKPKAKKRPKLICKRVRVVVKQRHATRHGKKAVKRKVVVRKVCRKAWPKAKAKPKHKAPAKHRKPAPRRPSR
jgi:hypothetical protein